MSETTWLAHVVYVAIAFAIKEHSNNVQFSNNAQIGQVTKGRSSVHRHAEQSAANELRTRGAVFIPLKTPRGCT